MRFIDYTDKAIMKILLEQIQQINPWLIIGEPLDGPIGIVLNGKVVKPVEASPPANLIKLQNIPAHLIPTIQTPQTVTAGSVRLKLNDIADFRVAGLAKLDFNLTKRGFLHPYMINISCREWMEDYKIGDMVSVEVLDANTFEHLYVQTPLTQQMIDENSDIIFRFALSEI